MSLPPPLHIPILVDTIVEQLLEPFPLASPQDVVVDFTFGGGGHTGALLSQLKARGLSHPVLAFDQDPEAIARGKIRFRQEIADKRLELYQARMSEADRILNSRSVLGMCADLGFSSDQMEDPARGLSFSSDGPLDMRLDPTRGQTAREWLLETSEEEIERVLREYGEERFSRRIASQIRARRQEKTFPETARAFSDLVVKAIPASARHKKIHAATKSFQALRIAVNGELKELDTFLERVILLLKPGGRVAILSFHSLEDRPVKLRFKDKDGPFRQLTKKPITADAPEVKLNPRARSAKLRVAERLEN